MKFKDLLVLENGNPSEAWNRRTAQSPAPPISAILLSFQILWLSLSKLAIGVEEQSVGCVTVALSIVFLQENSSVIAHYNPSENIIV